MSCYRTENNRLFNSSTVGDVPCPGNGPILQCCQSGDTCLKWSICQYNNVGSSGYYNSGCTDPTFQSDKCRTTCNGSPKGIIYFDPDSELWQCCKAANSLDSCSLPNNITFSAPAPNQLASITRASTSTPTSTRTSSSISSASTETISQSTTALPFAASSSTAASPTPSNTSSSGLSTGAKVGIAIGSVFGVAIMILLAILIKRRRSKPRDEDYTHKEPELPAYSKQGFHEADSKTVRSELDPHKGAYYEMGQGTKIHELGDGGR